MIVYLSAIETKEEKETFRKIYEENYLKMYHVALSFLRDKGEAENVVHEAFLSLAENFTKYLHLSDSSFAGLCVSIVKNKAISSIRQSNHYTDEEIENLVICDDMPEHDAEGMLLKEEEGMFVRKALAKIPEVLREALVLKYCYGLSRKEIARIQGVSLKALDKRLLRAKQLFREVWDETAN